MPEDSRDSGHALHICSPSTVPDEGCVPPGQMNFFELKLEDFKDNKSLTNILFHWVTLYN